MPTVSLFEYIAAKLEEPPLTPEELEFFAEHEKIEIIPNFTLNLPNSMLTCIEGTYGPFRPNIPIKVPLYLALSLYRRGKCRIQLPAWMAKEDLKGTLEEERTHPQYFQPVPQYYVEISKLLFTEARAIFGSNSELCEIQDLIEELKKVRNSKILDGLRKVSGPITVKLNHLSATESNKIRLLFENSLNMWHQLSKARPALLQCYLGPQLLHRTPPIFLPPILPLHSVPAFQNDKVWQENRLAGTDTPTTL